ncbi:leucyl aminopeptidase [Paenibacillus lemnae]|uniref:Probable cytosol aminopeptidase n=1 Tax=Paenibacillus lemnae TaxID=1330551 RepID=A0A848M637_PAELE|nr:leucyl aminopeptidase [Paenibacillus lemnae]NMO96076.1 leucyl aminopeptidase [Paenibacillus lemnae]
MRWTLQTKEQWNESSSDAHVLLVGKKDIQDGGVSAALDPVIRNLMDKGLFTAAPGKSYILPLQTADSLTTYILMGRTDGPMSSEELRLIAAQAAKAAIKIGAQSLSMDIPSTMQQFTLEQDVRVCAQALCEGFVLGAYRAKEYKRDGADKKQLQEVIYIVDSSVHESGFNAAWEEGAGWGQATGDAVILARDLVNLPGNRLTPDALASAASALAERHGMETEILDEHMMEQKGMGGVLAVGKGSVNPPRMIVIKYQGTDHWEDVIGLVGKGITFDTGGVSLKRAPGMEEMICDMGGSAAVLGVMEALGQLRPKVNVVMVVPSAENMPDGRAFKPGDIVTTMSGRTIEVLNTDAEGRVVLADGMSYAKELGANRIIDVATLTGAVGVALGDVATGAVTNDDVFMQELISSSRRAGEKVWPLPSYPEYWEMLKSDVADVKNSTGRMAGAITGGLFIGTFADGLPWIHLDIAGTAYMSKERGVNPKGGTGVMVRTITEWIRTQEM